MEPPEGRKMSPIDDSTLLQRLADKLDRLIEELPRHYQDKDTYERRHEAMAKRVDVLEQDLKDVRKVAFDTNEKIANLHNSSMSFVTDSFARINDKFNVTLESRLENSLKPLTEQVNKLDGKMDTLDGKIDAVKEKSHTETSLTLRYIVSVIVSFVLGSGAIGALQYFESILKR